MQATAAAFLARPLPRLRRCARPPACAPAAVLQSAATVLQSASASSSALTAAPSFAAGGAGAGAKRSAGDGWRRCCCASSSLSHSMTARRSARTGESGTARDRHRVLQSAALPVPVLHPPAAVLQSAATVNARAGHVGRAQVTGPVADAGATVVEAELGGRRVVTEAIGDGDEEVRDDDWAGQVAGVGYVGAEEAREEVGARARGDPR